MDQHGDIAIKAAQGQQKDHVPAAELGCVNAPVAFVGLQLPAAGGNLIPNLLDQTFQCRHGRQVQTRRNKRLH
jgi:hypothetical protein